MDIEKLHIDGFDDAPRKLIDLMLRLEDNDRAKSFFLAGWYNYANVIGTSAVLRAIAKLLKSGRGDPDITKHFGKIIHVDYSLCKNRRAMQREITKELNLVHLMPMFDKKDEDDDFRGIAISSRAEIQSIGSEIHASLRNETFIMIFHYEGEEELDLLECGIPNPEFGPYATGKLLWSGYGRFNISDIRGGFKSNPSNFKIISLYPSSNVGYHHNQVVPHFLHEEAAEVIDYIGMDDTVNPTIVLDCFLYSFILMEQQQGNNSIVDFEWDTHACNYWICDGILQGDKAWEVGTALHRVIQMVRFQPMLTGLLVKMVNGYLDRQKTRSKRWISISSNQQRAKDISNLPVNVSSYFLTFGGDGQLQLTNDMMFKLASNLRVLNLCKCTFDFASPPFRSCHNLRFLWLDRCTNEGEEQGGGPCFPYLLVLEIRFTNVPLLSKMIELMTNLREVNTKGVSWRAASDALKKLKNLHKLRVTGSSDVITVGNCSSVDIMNLELLDLSGNIHMESLPAMSSAGKLKILILDGCPSLQHVALEGAPPLLESFSFDGSVPTEKWTHPIELQKVELGTNSRTTDLVQEAKVTRISLKGCARLHNILLRALPNLEELDLSGTSVQALDLRAMDVPCLKKIFLLGCEKLRSLCWHSANRSLELIHVNTTRGKTRAVICCGEHMSSEALMTFEDGRFVWSFTKALYYIMDPSKLHLHISSTIQSQVNLTKSIEEIGPSLEAGLVPTVPFLPYKDIVLNKDIVTCLSLVREHQQLYPLGGHIEIGEGSHHLDSMNDNDDFSRLLQYKIESLHVHDNTSITAIFPGVPTYWYKLQWCHVERCPKLHTCFEGGTCYFKSLRIFSASDLPMAYCIWGTYTSYHYDTFKWLQHLYLHKCPRLKLVLHISSTLPNLESIHIEYCGNLQHIFPLEDECPQTTRFTFAKLKHIKLYHLHKLEQICGAELTAPALETISLRDCWALRRLPAVSLQGPKPVVDCEKDWWDRLEWDFFTDTLFKTRHDPSLFETRHSAHYKKTLPRVSVLR